MLQPQPTTITEAEYLALDAENDIKHEFVDGVVYAMVGASAAHNDLTVTLSAILYTALKGEPCKVAQGDMRVKAGNASDYFYPDLTIVCGERDFVPDATIATLTNPIVIIEVLSPSTELYDRTLKFQRYQMIDALQDYVLVAQDKARVECFSRGDDETWVLSQADGLAASIRLPSVDLTLKLAEIYEQIEF